MSEPSTPTVSIIIPCHNYAHTLTETLSSIKSQTLTSWEAIIVNDGSSDNTQEIIESFTLLDNRFIGIHQEQQGVSIARNNGIKVAKGMYIVFLDADDLFTPHKLEAHKTHFDSDPSIDVSYSYCQYFDTDNPGKLYASFNLTNEEWVEKISAQGNAMITRLMEKNLFVISSPMIRRAALPNNVTFKEGMKFYEDWLFWFLCATSNLSFSYCENKKCSTLIRVHSASTVQDKEKMFLGIPILRKEFEENLEAADCISTSRKKELKQKNRRHLEKWCRKNLMRSGVNVSSLKEAITATNKKIAYSAIAKHIIKKPVYFLRTFFRPK